MSCPKTGTRPQTAGYQSGRSLAGSLTRRCLPHRRRFPRVRGHNLVLVRMGLSRPRRPEKKGRRFHGAVTLDATRVGRDAGQIADEVISQSE